MPSTVDQVDVVNAAQATLLDALHTHTVGKIVSYDAAKNLAAVQLMIRKPLRNDAGERTYEPTETLPDVPVLWPRIGTYTLRGKLTSEDTGLLLFADRPWGEWLATGEQGEPADSRRTSIGYPAFLPGLYPNTSPIPQPEPVAGALMSIGDHGGSGAVIAFSSGEIMAGVGGVALAKFAAFSDFASKFATAVGKITPAPQTGPLLQAVFAEVVAAAGAIAANGATTVLKGK